MHEPGGSEPQHLFVAFGGHALTSDMVHEPDGLAPQQSGQALTAAKVQVPGGLDPQHTEVEPNKFIRIEDCCPTKFTNILVFSLFLIN